MRKDILKKIRQYDENYRIDETCEMNENDKKLCRQNPRFIKYLY